MASLRASPAPDDPRDLATLPPLPVASAEDRKTVVHEPGNPLPADLTTFGAAATAALRSERPAKPTRKAPASPKHGDQIAGRYTLTDRIGKGAQGEVWAAHDRLLSETVALKWLGPEGRASAVARREIAVLRMLRVPGVVQLIDEGVENGTAFVVMEHVAGAPFPGARDASGMVGWISLESTVLSLFETLARVHAAGVIHRDLKPANVLVLPSGRPVILDFGISHWSTDGLGAGSAGTPAYMAPEQIQGRSLDARADLYAVGIMIFEALSGEIPHRAGNIVQLLAARQLEPAKPLRSIAAEVPEHVSTVIDRLLAVRPDDRFRSASEVIAALRGERVPKQGRASQRRAPYSERSLRSFFAGPDRIFHLRQDGARALYEATRGDPSAVVAEVEAWERLGLARRDRDDVVIDRAALARLSALRFARAEGPTDLADDSGSDARAKAHRARAEAMSAGEEGRLFHLLSAGDRSAAAIEALATARARAERGDLSGATEALVLGLAAHRGTSAPFAREIALLSEIVKVALAEQTPAALDRALYELSRAEVRPPEIEALDALLRAALAAPGASGIEKAAAIPAFGDASLERRRHRIRIVAAAARTSPPLIAGALREVSAWASHCSHPMAALSLAECTALLHYAEGDYAAAARLHLEAAKREPWLTGRLTALLNASSALLEAFEHKGAARRAGQARKVAVLHRFPHAEARAEWLLRAARYRSGEPLLPDVELVELVARVGVPSLTALVCLNEAAVAFRRGEMALAADLAGQAARGWKQLDRPAGTLLATSLVIATGTTANLSTATAPDLDALCEQAKACPVPGIGLQALGLLSAESPRLRRSLKNDLERLAGFVPAPRRPIRMDVLSADESVYGLSATPASPTKAARSRASDSGKKA